MWCQDMQALADEHSKLEIDAFWRVETTASGARLNFEGISTKVRRL